MKTIILASGKSSRCAPLGDKNFLEFCGKPLLLNLLENAHNGGLSNFIIVSNGENDQKIQEIFDTQDFLKNAQIVPQKNLEEGMAGGVNTGLSLCGDDEPVMILGGNDFVDSYIYKEIINSAKGNDGAILAQKVSEYFPGGYISLDKNNKISGIIEKPEKGKEPSDLVNIIGHFFQKSVDLKTALKKAQSSKDDVYEIALDHLFRQKVFKAVAYSGKWQAIKFPWHVLEMKDVFIKRQIDLLKNSENFSDYREIQEDIFVHKNAQISPTAIFAGRNIIIEAESKIFHHAVINSDVFLAKNCIVGNNALIRSSMIGSGCTIGYNTEIARSILMSEVSSHMAYIGDSVIESGVNFGAYSCTANLRLDKKTVRVDIKGDKIDSGFGKLGAFVGKNAQIGIHASLMPGAKIKAAELVGPGSVRSF